MNRVVLILLGVAVFVALYYRHDIVKYHQALVSEKSVTLYLDCEMTKKDVSFSEMGTYTWDQIRDMRKEGERNAPIQAIFVPKGYHVQVGSHERHGATLIKDTDKMPHCFGEAIRPSNIVVMSAPAEMPPPAGQEKPEETPVTSEVIVEQTVTAAPPSAPTSNTAYSAYVVGLSIFGAVALLSLMGYGVYRVVRR